jgi:response regulator RpfG family c-di-GMP phosphodiesterase
MPGRTGYDICQYIKMSPRLRHVRVILSAGVLEPFDEAQLQRAAADGTLKKPFEASALLAAVKPLAEEAAKLRAENTTGPSAGKPEVKAPVAVAPFIAVVDSEQVRAAVTIALDAAMGNMIDEITRHVLAALQTEKPHVPEHTAPQAAPPHAPPASAAPEPAAPPAPPLPRIEPVRRVNPLRTRSGSILGLDPDADRE